MRHENPLEIFPYGAPPSCWKMRQIDPPPPPPWKIQSLLWGWYGYFLELPICLCYCCSKGTFHLSELAGQTIAGPVS